MWNPRAEVLNADVSFSAFQFFSFFLRGAGGKAGLAGGGKE
jgi:hypothetical protein